MGLFRNVGPSWRRASGDVVPHGGTFTPTDRELARMQRRHQIGRRFRPVETKPVPPEPKPEPTPEPIAASSDETEWPLERYGPAEYLERWPDGPHSVLARAILNAEEDSSAVVSE